jgi:phosphoribosylformylglycinamidine cyclo-ligase
VGVAEKSELDRVSQVQENDVLIAMPSSGFHSNGFSLVRKVLFEKMGMNFNDDFNGRPLIDVLLEPTRIYVKLFKELKDNLVAMAHITGGGLVENLPRVLPAHLYADVDKSKLRPLPIFELLADHVEEEEMYRAFNMGIGMVFVARPENVDAVLAGSDGYVIGTIKTGERCVKMS